jgi:hypothetical protein
MEVYDAKHHIQGGDSGAVGIGPHRFRSCHQRIGVSCKLAWRWIPRQWLAWRRLASGRRLVGSAVVGGLAAGTLLAAPYAYGYGPYGYGGYGGCTAYAPTYDGYGNYVGQQLVNRC